MSGERAVVMFSGGLGSFGAAVRSVERYGRDGVTLLFTDTSAEDADCYRFVDEASAALGVGLVRLRDGRTPWDVADDEHMIPNSRVPLCSRVLKHEPARAWLKAHDPAAERTVVVGIGWSEGRRRAGVANGYEPWAVWFPMCDAPYVGNAELAALSRGLGVEPPRMYAFGYAHANCAGACLRAGQAAWRHLLLDSPDLYAEHERREEAFREREGKDVAVLRHRGGAEEGKPLTLRELRQTVEAGGAIDLFDWGGCGCSPALPTGEDR